MLKYSKITVCLRTISLGQAVSFQTHHRSVSGGQRQKGAKMNAVILFFFSFFFFCWGRDIFAKIKHTKLTYYSTFISLIQHKISIFSLLFSWNWCGEQVFIYFSSLGFSFGLFFDLLQMVAMVRGTQFWASVGNFCFCFELFGFIRIYSVFSAGLAWGIMAKTLPEISSNWAFTLSKTGSIWALFKI